MILLPTLLIVGLAALATGAPDRAELDVPDNAALGRRSVSAANTADRNPILEYLLTPAHARNEIPPGGKREFTVLQAFPQSTPPSKRKPVIVTAAPKNRPRDPNKSPYENFTGYIMAGRKPEDNLVESPSVTISDKLYNGTLTKVDVVPAVATIVRSYDENGTLRASFTRYEPAGSGPTAESEITRQQLTWPYASYFPVLIKDPFLTLFHTLAAGNSFSLSSLVEYGPAADVCSSKKEHLEKIADSVVHADLDMSRKTKNFRELSEEFSKTVASERHLESSKRDRQRRQAFVFPPMLVQHLRSPYSGDVPAWTEVPRRATKTTRLTVNDPEKGLATIRMDNPENESNEPKLSVRKGGTSIAGPGGYATAYTGGTAVVGPYGTVFKSPEGVVVAGPHSKIINITDSTSFAEILRMYEESKANKTQGRSLETSVSVEKQAEIGNIAEKVSGDYVGVNKLFSFKSHQPATLIAEGGLYRARKTARTIERSDAIRGKTQRRLARRGFKIRQLSNELDPAKARESISQYREESKEEWDRLRKQTQQDFAAQNGETTLVFAPKTKAEAGRDGIAISSPVSYAEVHPGQNVHLVFQPQASAIAGPGGFAHAHSDLFVRDTYYSPEDIEARANLANLLIPPLSSVNLPPLSSSYDMKKKKKPGKPDEKEEEEESEENVGEQEETSSQDPDSVAINPPPEGSSVAEAKPVGLAIAGPGGVASSKPVAQAIVGPGGLAIARPVATAIAGVDVEGGIPIGSQQKKPMKKKPKQDLDDSDPDTELQYVGGLSGPIGSPKPKNAPPETNYIGGLRGVVGNPIPKHEHTPPAANSRQFQYKLGFNDGKYGFLPYFQPAALQAPTQARTLERRVDTPNYFHGMIGSNANSRPASTYPLVYYS